MNNNVSMRGKLKKPTKRKVYTKLFEEEDVVGESKYGRLAPVVNVDPIDAMLDALMDESFLF